MAETNDTIDETTDEAAAENGPTQREKYLSRRRYLMATGSVAGAGILAGCGQSGGGGTTTGEATTSTATSTTTSTATATETNTETTQETTEETTQQQQQDDRYTYTRQELQQKYPGLEILVPSPPNAQAASLSTYETFLTGTDEEYIRSHYDSPRIEESEHTISLTGLAGENVEITMAQLEEEFSIESVVHTMQCSGNGRSYFEPQVAGNQWSFGAVGTARYTGAPLSEVLERYDVDTGEGMWLSVMGADAPEGEDVFARSIPMSKVTDDCMLAYERNGEALTAEHGFPVRIIVPGWYGCNNVKWVDRMHVMDKMLYGPEWNGEQGRNYTHWQQSSYRIVPAQDSEPQRYESIDVFDTYQQMESTDRIRNAYMYGNLVKSLIGYPTQGATVSPGPAGTIEVVGVAWAGGQAVEGVEVSTDGGESFEAAEFFGPNPGSAAWRQFRYVWENPQSGQHTVVSRATDADGRSQPATISGPDAGLRGIRNDQFPWNKSGYGSNAYMPESVDVTVEQQGTTGGGGTDRTTTGESTTTGGGNTNTTTSGSATNTTTSGNGTTTGGN